MNIVKKRKTRKRRPDPSGGPRITEDGIPSNRERVMRLLRAGSRLELQRLAGNLIPQEGESEDAFEARIERSIDHQISKVYRPEPAEIAEIFQRASRARFRLAQQAEMAADEEAVETGGSEAQPEGESDAATSE